MSIESKNPETRVLHAGYRNDPATGAGAAREGGAAALAVSSGQAASAIPIQTIARAGAKAA